MRWQAWGKYAIRADQVAISRAMLRGEWIYTLWRLPSEVIGFFSSPEAAKAAAVGLIAGSQEGIATSGNTSQGATHEV